MKNKIRSIAIAACIFGVCQAGHADEIQTDTTPDGTYNEPERLERIGIKPMVAVPDPEKLEDLGQIEDEFHREVDRTDPETKAAIRRIEAAQEK